MNTLLRDHRLRRDLTPAEVARRLAVHPTSVLRWERRERLPGPVHIRALASTLSLDTTTVAAFFDEVRPASHGAHRDPRGDGLRPLRRRAGLDVRTIAAALGVLPSTVYNGEAGRVRIPALHLAGLATLLGVSAAELPALLARRPEEPAPPSQLRRLRRRTGLSQERVAQRIGTTRHRVGAWERGERPPLWAVRRLAREYGVPVAQVARAAGVTPPLLLDVRRWRPGDLPAVLVALREWSGLRQRDVAGRHGWHPTTVRSWESGRARPSATSRVLLEELYGLPAGALQAAYPPVSSGAGLSSPARAGSAR